MIDRDEAKRRGQSPPKTSTKHTYAATEHRVIDSPAYADLTFSARALLTMLTRQLSKDNNGHLQAAHSYMAQYGFAENTLSRAIKELIAHGFVYRTRSGGYQQGASQYAVTWLSITNRQGLFLDGFKPCAWRDWTPEDKKTPPPKLRPTNRKNGIRTTATPPIFEASSPPKIEDNELMPVVGGVLAAAARVSVKKPRAPSFAPPQLIRRQTTADRGQLRVLH